MAKQGYIRGFSKAKARPGGKSKPAGKPRPPAKPGVQKPKRRHRKYQVIAPAEPAKAAPPQPAVVAAAAAPVGGDDDDFLDMLNTMEDYQPVDDAALDSDTAAAQQGEVEEAAAGKKAKRRRNKGQAMTAMEFEARRQMVKQIAESPAEEQANWLWGSYQRHAAASALERGGLTAEGMAVLPPDGSLEERLRTLRPSSWQQDFCSRSGGGGSQQQQQQQQQQTQQTQQPGSPVLLLVSPSAVGANGLIKLCPQFNRACHIAKLFAKHIKVAEQVELLRTQVVCIGAGTPNRLCKLADDGALQLDRLRHVVLDVQLDAKQRDVLAIPETCQDWWQFYDRHLKQRVDSKQVQLSLVNSDHVAAASLVVL